MQSTPLLSIHLLGQPRFSIEKEPFRFSAPPRTLPLLAYLLLHRSSPIAREKLAFTLWEEESEDDARANLRRHLHHLTRALPAAASGASWLITEGDTVQWNPASGARLDVAEFERLAPEEPADAVELYAGDLLESLYDEWVFPDRDRLRNMYVSLLQYLLVQCRGTRDYGRAATYAQRILINDPWREDTVRQLMTVRYESGDRAGALAVYQQFDQRLREEMNVEPMPETVALRDVILRNEQTFSPPAESVVADPAGAPLLPFVGRENELEQLRAVWSRAARGRGSVVLIGGEAGIGKSRLVGEFALVAESQGARVMSGATTYPESAPYQAISEAFRTVAPLLASLRVQPIWLSVVAQAVPDLRVRIPDLPTPPKVRSDRERLRLFEAFSTCLEALAQPRPLVLVLEDLHWAGEATIAALQFLGRRIARLPILIMATYRDEEAPRAHPLRRARRELQQENVLSTVSPQHLRREAVERLTNLMPSLAGRGAAIVDTLLRQSAGNPLFLSEVIHRMQEGPDSDSSAAPASARHVIAQRVSRLNESSRVLAEVAAIVGQGFNVDILCDVTGWSENEVIDALSDLIDRHMVRETGGRTGYAYAFTHHVIQSTIYAGTPADLRTLRHRRIAQVLEESYPNKSRQLSADVARHYDFGKEPELAAAASLAAAQQACDVYAYDEALAYLARCLELSNNPDTRRSALAMRASICARRGDRAGQREAVDDLARIATVSGDVEFVCDVLQRQVMLARALGERDQERLLVEEFVTRAEESANPRLRAESLLALAAYATLTGDHPGARAAAESALEIYASLGDATGQVEARCRLVEIASEGGAFAVATALLADVRRSAAAARNPGLVARAISSATHAAISEMRYAQCRELALEARELYRTVGDREGEADIIARQASAAARLGLFDEARQCYDDARDIFDAIGKRQGLAAVLVNGGIHSVRLGVLDEAEKALRGALEHFRALKDVRGVAAAQLNLSYVRLFRGDPQQAKQYAQEALDLARSMPHPGYEATALANLGAAERDTGDLQAALAHMNEGLEIRRRLNRSVDFADDLAHLTLAYLMLEDMDTVRRLSDDLSSALQAASPDIFMPEFAFWVAAQAFRAGGQPDRSRGMLEKAHEIVVKQAAAITHARNRQNYLELGVNHDIEAAYEHDKWPALRSIGHGHVTANS